MTAWPDLVALPPRARTLLLSSALNNFGSGLVLPVLVAYVTRGLGLDIRWASTAIALTSVGAAVAGPLAGGAADRWGRLSTVLATLGVAMCGSVAYGLAQRPAGVLVAALLLGLGVGGNAAWFTMLAESVDDELRPVVFGANLMMVNIALGLGGLVGGIALQSSGPAGFRVLYVANALTFVLAAALLWRLREPGGTPANASTRARQLRGSEPGSRLAVLRTPGLVPVLALSVAAFLAGYSQLEVAVPGVMLKQGLGTVHVAAAFTVNTVVVVIGQFLLLPRLRHRPPLANVVGFALLWSLGWCALAAVTLSDMVALSTVLGSLCLGLFALGECLYAVTLPTMVNALATDANRGMVNGLYTMATSVGFFAGPLVSGQIFVVAGPRSLAVALAVGCGAIAAVAVIVGARASRAVALEPVDV